LHKFAHACYLSSNLTRKRDFNQPKSARFHDPEIKSNSNHAFLGQSSLCLLPLNLESPQIDSILFWYADLALAVVLRGKLIDWQLWSSWMKKRMTPNPRCLDCNIVFTLFWDCALKRNFITQDMSNTMTNFSIKASYRL
jgi:hypothetical protein